MWNTFYKITVVSSRRFSLINPFLASPSRAQTVDMVAPLESPRTTILVITFRCLRQTRRTFVCPVGFHFSALVELLEPFSICEGERVEMVPNIFFFGWWAKLLDNTYSLQRHAPYRSLVIRCGNIKFFNSLTWKRELFVFGLFFFYRAWNSELGNMFRVENTRCLRSLVFRLFVPRIRQRCSMEMTEKLNVNFVLLCLGIVVAMHFFFK